ncbi:ThiF family adenylyltransferase [Paenochrobactrum sp. BZR 588]|uniref:ThiF family adenylyltransferase n=1 Tax=unclassified Paenochrobactrum TaxID=2639760 RepID=UPI003853484D
MSRYARQIIVEEMGEERQKRLENSHILIIGAGGLGCPALNYLVGAGVGHITLVDDDSIERSNLHRQPLYGEKDLGRKKAEAARDRLNDLNPDVIVTPLTVRLTPANVDALLKDADIALDCADSYAVTYILSDACKALGKPLISASALGLNGYVGGYCGNAENGAPSVRALFPDLPKNLATCASAGVLGPLVGTLGTIQAQMAIAALTDMSPSPLGQMVTVNLSQYGFRSFRFDKAPEPKTVPFAFIAPEQLLTDDVLIELRDTTEAPQSLREDALRYSTQDFLENRVDLATDKRVALCCRSGLRAWRAASALRQVFSGHIVLVAAGDSSPPSPSVY